MLNSNLDSFRYRRVPRPSRRVVRRDWRWHHWQPYSYEMRRRQRLGSCHNVSIFARISVSHRSGGTAWRKGTSHGGETALRHWGRMNNVDLTQILSLYRHVHVSVHHCRRVLPIHVPPRDTAASKAVLAGAGSPWPGADEHI